MLRSSIDNYQELKMVLSSISNSPLATNKTSHQKAGTTTEQAEKKNNDLASDKNIAGNKFNDNVTLSKSVGIPTSEEINVPADDSFNVPDAKSAEKLLNKIMKSIMADSKTAVSAHSNLNPQALQELLADK